MKEVPSYRNQTTDLLYKSIDWFLYDRDSGHERVNMVVIISFLFKILYQPKFGYMTMTVIIMFVNNNQYLTLRTKII